MLEKYNREQITFRQLLALVHVWAMDNPKSSALILIWGLGFCDDPQDDVISSYMESTYRGNLTFDSRAQLEEDFRGTPRDIKVNVTFEEVE